MQKYNLSCGCAQNLSIFSPDFKYLMMQKLSAFLVISILALFIVSCKNETKNEEVDKATVKVVKAPEGKRAKKKVLTPEDIEEINSVMSRVMTDSELKNFASYIVTAGLAEKLSTEKGPFAIFAPSNSALESLSAEKKKFYANPDNKAKLEEMLKSHIVEGSLDKEALLQIINKSGKAKLKTLSGITLTASKSGDDIIIVDGKGVKAKTVKGSTLGSNGVLYVVDGVMNAN